MNIEPHVISLPLAKKLKELDVLQESLFYWVTTTLDHEFYLVISEEFDVIGPHFAFDGRPLSLGMVYQDSGSEGDSWDTEECYAAFTVAELGELLPRCYISWATPQTGEMKWWCHRMERHFVTHEETPTFSASTEADVRAKMLIYYVKGRKDG